MSTTPVRIIAWFEPVLTSDVPVSSSIRLRCTVLDIDTGQPVDPDVLTLVINTPLGAQAPSVTVKEAVGTYRFDYSPGLVVGEYAATWSATSTGGINTGSATSRFNVVGRGF